MRHRAGFSLTEILLAAALLGGLALGLISVLLTTQRQAGAGEALLHSGVLAQIVIERLRAQLAANPRFFREQSSSLVWSHEGPVVAAAGADPADVSPFFRHLFTASGPPALAAGGPDADPLAVLARTYRDYHVQVDIRPDVDLETPAAPTALAELVRRVTVTVSRRSGSAPDAQDPQSCTITARLVTPSESLSLPALGVLTARFAGPTLAEQWEEFRMGADLPFMRRPELGPAARNTITDAYIMLAAANTESLLTEGRYVPRSVLLGVTPGMKHIDPWIAELSRPASYAFSSTKRALAGLYMRKALVIADAYRKIKRPLKHLIGEVLGPNPDNGAVPVLDRIRRLSVALRSGLGREQVVQLDPEAVIIARTLCRFFGRPGFDEVSRRPGRYEERFRAVLDGLARLLEDHLDQPADVTPLERSRSAQAYYEVTVARQLMRGQIDDAAVGRLRALGASFTARNPDLARYLSGGEVADLAAQRRRNEAFVELVSDFARICERYRNLDALLAPGGEIALFVAAVKVDGP